MKICLKCNSNFSANNWTCPACSHEPLFNNEIAIHAPEFAKSGGGFIPEYFGELVQLESDNFWFQSRNKLILWALHRYACNAQNFLEVGCGTGYVLSGVSKSFPKISLCGSEIFLAGLSFASQRVPNARFIQMDARRIPFSEEFDAIGVFDVLEHIEEDIVVLEQICSSLKPNGVLLITVPQHPCLWSNADRHACHVRRYTKLEIESKVRTSGMEVVKSTSFVTLLLPAMIASRLFQTQVTNLDNFDPKFELKINYFLNKIFYLVMCIEIIAIKMGLNFIIGGSRLIIAKKIN